MSIVDVEKIINYSPAKRIHNGYESLKANYTKEAALNYKSIYTKEKLSDILESSRYIFTEPYYGLDFYKSLVLTESTCIFNKLESELGKVKDYYEEFSSRMDIEQQALYNNLINAMESKIAETKNTRLYTSYIEEYVDNEFETDLSNALYEYYKNESADDKSITDLFKLANDELVHFVYVPYAIESTIGADKVSGKLSAMYESYIDYSDLNRNSDAFKSYCRKVICGNKLSNDTSYMEAVDSILNHNCKDFFKYYIERNLLDDLNDFKFRVENVPEVFEDAQLSVNSLFDDFYVDDLNNDKYLKEKSTNDLYDYIAYSEAYNILVHESSMEDSLDDIEGFSLLESEGSIKDNIDSIYNKLSTNKYYIESTSNEDEYVSESDDDFEDDIAEDDDIEDEENTPEPKKEEPKKNEKELEEVSKKSSPPKAKDKLTAISNKAMDLESKQMKAYGELKRRGETAKGAIKAVSKLPANVIKDITSVAKAIENLDTNRRKDFLIKPGYRKKVFRNFKLATLYGTVAQINLAWLPITMLNRHYSKVKDRRVRNELLFDLNTEIKLLDSRIGDLENGSDADKELKYSLIRKREELKKHMLRVTANSTVI